MWESLKSEKQKEIDGNSWIPVRFFHVFLNSDYSTCSKFLNQLRLGSDFTKQTKSKLWETSHNQIKSILFQPCINIALAVQIKFWVFGRLNFYKTLKQHIK